MTAPAEPPAEPPAGSPAGAGGRAGVRGLRGVAELTALADVRAAAKDWERFSSRLQGDPDVRDYPQLPLEVDPPEHGAYRALVEPILGRRAILALDAEIRAIARRLVGRFAERGRTEAVHELAIPIVATTIATVLGVPDDAAELGTWGISSWEVRADGTRSGSRIDAYVARVLDEGADPGRQDAFAGLTRATLGERPLSRVEQVGIANLLLAGGRDTVILVLCGAMWHLASDAGARARLRTEPDRLPLAIEEYLRYLSPNPGMERRVVADVEGTWGRASRGDYVVLGWGPANHDPSAFEAPAEIRLDRRPNPHLAFGSGPHTCIGIHLARHETRIFLEELLAAVPDWRLGEGIELQTMRLGDDVVPSRFDVLPLEIASPD
jgi:cytochrome P450